MVDSGTTHSLDYTELSTTARVQLGVGRSFATRDGEAPTSGFEGRALDSFEVRADLNDTPIVTNRSFDGRLHSVLSEIADFGNFVWAVTADSDGQTTVEWTRIEGREEGVDPDVASYSIDRQTEDVVERAIIYGGAQNIRRIPVTVQHSQWVDIDVDGRIVDGKESLYVDDGEEFGRGEDYEVRYAEAQIKALSDGSLSDGQTVRLDAEVKPRGSYTRSDMEDADHPRTGIEDVPGLASQQMCEQVALYLVERAGEALVEGSVTIPHDAVEWSVVDAIDPSQLPGAGPYQVHGIDAGTRKTAVQLGSGKSVDEAMAEIRATLSQTSERA